MPSKSHRLLRTALWASVAVLCPLTLITAQQSLREAVAFETRSADAVHFEPQIEADLWILRVSGPTGVMQWSDERAAPSFRLLDERGDVLPDGNYNYELIPSFAEGEERENEALGLKTGSLRVQGGAILLEQQPEPAAPQTAADEERPDQVGGLNVKRAADVALTDDYCIGQGCTAIGSFPSSGPNTGFLKLKGVATGIVFSDTSGTGGTDHDWQLSANDGSFSGASFFAVFDNGSSGDAGAFNSFNTVAPFLIEEGAGSNALRIRSITGDVGLGTATPAQELDIADADPSIRLADSAGREWTLNNDPDSFEFDIVSTEGGVMATRHIYINRDAPADQLALTASGIGIGTTSPNATMEIRGSSGTSQMAVTEQGANSAVEVMLNLICNCAPAFRMTNTSNGQVWFFRHLSGGDFSFDDPSAAGQEMRLTSTGNLFLKGSLSQGSSRALKENLAPADGAQVLDALAGLDLYEWSYIDQEARHFGPMAEDFATAYGLGSSRAKIAPADMAGLALAGLKKLSERNAVLEAQVAELQSLLERVTALEKQSLGE